MVHVISSAFFFLVGTLLEYIPRRQLGSGLRGLLLRSAASEKAVELNSQEPNWSNNFRDQQTWLRFGMEIPKKIQGNLGEGEGCLNLEDPT